MRKILRNTLAGIEMLMFALFFMPVQELWLAFWGTWGRFWCAVRLWGFLGYRWGAAWRKSSNLTEDKP